jgi:hypothetical protein
MYYFMQSCNMYFADWELTDRIHVAFLAADGGWRCQLSHTRHKSQILLECKTIKVSDLIWTA